MLIDVEKLGSKLKISYYNKEGNVAFKDYNITNPGKWVVANNKDKKKNNISDEYLNWDGRDVKKIPSKFLNKYAIIEFLDNLPQSEQDELFANNMPKTYFCDIETEVSDSFPEPERAEQKITAIAVSTPNDEVIVMATKDMDQDRIKDIQNKINAHLEPVGRKFAFIFKPFKTEYDMLYTFLAGIVKKVPMMAGWNFIDFDWRYIVNRARKIGIDPAIASPSGKLQGNNEFPMHVGIYDYLELYRRLDRTVDIKENFKLDTVGDAVIGLKKIKYSGSLQQLYEQDYDKYIFYNAVDTILVQLIHEKIKTLEIALTLSNICKVSIYRAMSPVVTTESILCRAYLQENKVMAEDPYKLSNSFEGKFTGAYVKKPVVGMHRGIACFDFASLYPSVMRQYNISPESFIKKVDIDQIEAEKGPDKIVTVNGCVYQTETSVLKKILIDLYAKRKVYKNRFWELEMEVEELKEQMENAPE